MKLKESYQGIIYCLLSILCHNIVRVSKIISVLNHKVASLMILEVAKEELHISNIGKRVCSAIAEEEWKLLWNIRYVV